MFGCGGLQPDPSTGRIESASSRPVARPAAGVREREHHDLVAFNLIKEREREAIQRGDTTVRPIFPLRRRPGKLKDCFENRVDLVFELGSQPGTA